MKSEPTEHQRRLFCEMIHQAFLELRSLGFHENTEQAAALADAFHNLPTTMYQSNFDWAMSRRYFESYNSHYPPGPETRAANYVVMHDRVQAADVEDAT